MRFKSANYPDSDILSVGTIKAAIKAAEDSTYYPFRVGAVIFKGSRILSTGHNGVRSSNIHPRYKNYQESLHAEQAALLNLDWTRLSRCSILIIRLNMSGNLSMAKPCPMCSKLLSYVGIRKIYFSTSSGEIIRLLEVNN